MTERIITVESIVREKLEAMGADGLCSDDCGCDVKDLAPCDEICGDCRPAWKYTCSKCGDLIYWATPRTENVAPVCWDCKEAPYA